MERTGGWEIFSIRGVPIRLHVSLVFLIFYVFLIATLQFPLVAQRSGVNVQFLMNRPAVWGALLSIAVVLSILIHELSHVFVAQALGGKVRRITLMMLGGASEITNLPEKPYGELKMAIIGPIVSLFLGLILYVISNSVNQANVSFFTYWVGTLNIGLGIFNLLPAFPTDGGRVLRSLLEARMGKIKGTRVAVRVSNAFSLFFAAVGLLQVNLLLLLIALFIYSAAKSEWFMLSAEDALKGMKVSDLIVESPSVSDEQTLSEAAQVMFRSHHTAIPVKTANDSYAILDAATLERIPQSAWDDIPVAKAEITVPRSVEIDEPLENALKTVLSSGAAGVPVTDHRELKGVIRMTDLMNAIQLRKLALRSD